MKDFKRHQRQHLPTPTGPYKVVLHSPSIWRDFSECRLQISVGRAKHEGDKFFALTEWAAARFDKVTFVVSDTLQRHNLALDMGIDLDEAYDVALIKGREWLRDNKRAIDNVPAHKKNIMLWDDWLSHPDYAETRIEINTLYAYNPFFKLAVDAKANEFLDRRAAQGEDLSGRRSEIFKISVRYILEEMAAFAIMLRQQPVLDIYPGPWFKEIFDLIAQTSTNPLLSGFEHAAFIHVGYRINGAYLRQGNAEDFVNLPEESKAKA